MIWPTNIWATLLVILGVLVALSTDPGMGIAVAVIGIVTRFTIGKIFARFRKFWWYPQQIVVNNNTYYYNR